MRNGGLKCEEVMVKRRKGRQNGDDDDVRKDLERDIQETLMKKMGKEYTERNGN